MSSTAVAPKITAPAPTRSGTAIATTMLPGCCGLKVAHKLNCIGNTDELSKKHAEGFDEKVKKNTADDGMWAAYGKAPETICVISDSPSYTKPEEFERQVAFLKSKGWTLICQWPSLEGSRRKEGALNYMWGSPGIKKL